MEKASSTRTYTYLRLGTYIGKAEGGRKGGRRTEWCVCFSTYYYYVPTFTIPTALLFPPPPPPPAPFRSPTFFSHARQGGERAKASRVRDGRRRGRAKRNNARSGSGGGGERERGKGGERKKNNPDLRKGRKGEKGGGGDFSEDDPRDRPWRRRPKRPRP